MVTPSFLRDTTIKLSGAQSAILAHITATGPADVYGTHRATKKRLATIQSAMRRLEEMGYVRYLRSERGLKGGEKRLYTLTFPGLCGGLYVLGRDGEEILAKDDEEFQTSGSDDILLLLSQNVEKSSFSLTTLLTTVPPLEQCRHADQIQSLLTEWMIRVKRMQGDLFILGAEDFPKDEAGAFSPFSGESHSGDQDFAFSDPKASDTTGADSHAGACLPERSGSTQNKADSNKDPESRSDTAPAPEKKRQREEAERDIERQWEAYRALRLGKLSGPAPSTQDRFSFEPGPVADLIVAAAFYWSTLHPLLTDWPETIAPYFAWLDPDDSNVPEARALLAETLCTAGSSALAVYQREVASGKVSVTADQWSYSDEIRADVHALLWNGGVPDRADGLPDAGSDEGASRDANPNANPNASSDVYSELSEFSDCYDRRVLGGSGSRQIQSVDKPEAIPATELFCEEFSEVFVNHVLYEADRHAAFFATSKQKTFGSATSLNVLASELGIGSSIASDVASDVVSHIEWDDDTSEEESAFYSLLSALEMSPATWEPIQKELTVRVHEAFTRLQAYLMYLGGDEAYWYGDEIRKIEGEWESL